MATTTNYGWTTPNDSDPFKNGASAIRTLGSSADTTLFTALGGAYPGLRLVKKQTIGSAVTSVQVTNAFSATYENYRILVSGGTSTGDGDMRYSLDGITTGYYTGMTYVNFATATVLGINQTAATFFNWSGTTAASGNFYMDFDIKNPFTAKAKVGRGTFIQQSITGVAGESHMYNASTASATGFTITASVGTITGGTIYVYGYGAS
jgi:hypothetical protein